MCIIYIYIINIDLSVDIVCTHMYTSTSYVSVCLSAADCGVLSVDPRSPMEQPE